MMQLAPPLPTDTVVSAKIGGNDCICWQWRHKSLSLLDERHCLGVVAP